ncbi:MAG TPA: DUF389 domain-containing protein [Longimicrobiales bacterium]|nr:DUF389 domain-containing protein [Longimicrobiales bacterium]
MRLLQVQVAHADRDRVLDLAREHGARSPVSVRADACTLIFATLPNDTLGAFAHDVSDAVSEATFTILPVGALPLETPLGEIAGSVRDVSRLSTLELVLASVQSVGSWPGLLLFSLLAGTIGAYGLIFDTAYLLVAAMLINPMGAPALVAVTAMAVGDGRMFGRGAVRFAASLAIQAATAMALGFAYGLTVSTAMMEQVTSLSSWAVVVALAAGAAGAQSQVKSERDSLVSGTAAGFMVAAALAPPAAVLGLAVALGRPDYMALMAFLLLLQFLAIAVGGWLVFRGFGVRPGESGMSRGTARVRTVLVTGVAAITVGLVAWQAGREPRFQKADVSRTALEVARDATARVDGVYLIESSAHFTRRDIQRYDREALLLEIIVENTTSADDDVVADDLRREVRRLADSRMPGVIPFIDVTVLAGPGP